MFIATLAVSALLAVALVASASGKLRRSPQIIAGMEAVHVPLERVWMLAVLELAGAAGLLVGLVWWPLGAAAAVGVVLYFLGAVVFHVRAKAPGLAAPLVLGLLGAAALVLRVLSA